MVIMSFTFSSLFEMDKKNQHFIHGKEPVVYVDIAFVYGSQTFTRSLLCFIVSLILEDSVKIM